jgi:hypothetical protein
MIPDYGNPHPRGWFQAKWYTKAIGSMVAVTGMTFGVLWHSASNEPFYGFAWSEALVQIGLSCIGLSLAFAVLIWVAVGLFRRELRPGWILLALWDLATLMILSFCLLAYLSDLNTTP